MAQGDAAQQRDSAGLLEFADESEPVDSYPPKSTRTKLLLGGLGTTAGFYAVSLTLSYGFPEGSGIKHHRIPVAGPWMALASNSCSGDCNRFAFWLRNVGAVVMGLGQAGGVLIALESLWVPTVDTDLAPPATRPKTTKPVDKRPDDSAPVQNLFLAPTPMGVGASGVGLNLSGTF